MLLVTSHSPDQPKKLTRFWACADAANGCSQRGYTLSVPRAGSSCFCESALPAPLANSMSSISTLVRGS
eukprot:802683-Rhodomonas_salina.1